MREFKESVSGEERPPELAPSKEAPPRPAHVEPSTPAAHSASVGGLADESRPASTEQASPAGPAVPPFRLPVGSGSSTRPAHETHQAQSCAPRARFAISPIRSVARTPSRRGPERWASASSRAKPACARANVAIHSALAGRFLKTRRCSRAAFRRSRDGSRCCPKSSYSYPYALAYGERSSKPSTRPAKRSGARSTATTTDPTHGRPTRPRATSRPYGKFPTTT